MITSQALSELVRNTAPFIFHEKPNARTRFIEILSQNPPPELTPETKTQFYEFCVAAHFATVGTFVPTDVDNAIREKLWKRVYNEADLLPMWKIIQEFLTWDESLVSKRFVISPSGIKLSGHQGEWFSIAMGAYGTSLKVAHGLVPEIRTSIESVVKDHEQALKELREQFLENATAPNAIQFARAYLDGIAAVAHNLGDLDRMFDAWEIGETDVLKRRVYRCGHEDARNPKPEFLLAGKIYQELLANENHRHFPLREPKSIRKSSEFLLNYGPFLDEWGVNLIRAFQAGRLNEGELREVLDALILGWKRLNPKSIYTSQGYSRALCGIMNSFPRARADLEALLPPALCKELNEGGLRTLMGVSRTQFETQWVRKLYRLLPSDET